MKPKILPEVIVRLGGVELQREHQLLHKRHESAISRSSSDNQMKVGIALHLRFVVRGVIARGARVGDDLVELCEGFFCHAPYAQLYRKQNQSIQKRKDLRPITLRPRSYIRTSWQASLDNADLLELVYCISHGCPAHLKDPRKLLFPEPLAGSKDPVAYTVENLEDNPIGEISIGGRYGEVRNLRKNVELHLKTYYSICLASY